MKSLSGIAAVLVSDYYTVF